MLNDSYSYKIGCIYLGENCFMLSVINRIILG